MHQKKPPKSRVHPIGGTPGCVFLMAGIANSKAAQIPIVGGSTFRSLNHKVLVNLIYIARINIEKLKDHMLKNMNIAKNITVTDRVVSNSRTVPAEFSKFENLKSNRNA